MEQYSVMVQAVIDSLNWLVGKIPLYFPPVQIQIVLKTEYKNCPIYILHFQNCFMRLFVFNGQVYQNHCFMKPANPLRYLSYMFYLRRSPYNQEEWEGGRDALMAETVEAIDQISKAGSVAKVLEENKIYPTIKKDEK